jgi:hypothetical protein
MDERFRNLRQVYGGLAGVIDDYRGLPPARIKFSEGHLSYRLGNCSVRLVDGKVPDEYELIWSRDGNCIGRATFMFGGAQTFGALATQVIKTLQRCAENDTFGV